MVLNFSFKQMDASDAIRFYATEKSERLQSYFSGRLTVSWNFSVQAQSKVAHCHVTGDHMDYFAEASDDTDLHAAIDSVIDKIERQVRKHKEVVKDHLHKNGHRVPKTG